MKSTEFKQLRLAVSGLDHQQRKQLLETLAHQTDKVQVTELSESSFDGKKACPHCHSVKLYRFGVVSGLQRYRRRDGIKKPASRRGFW